MRLDKVFRIFTAVLLAVILAAASPLAPAQAAGETITLSSNQGAIGQEITITGKGFYATNSTDVRGVNVLFGKYPDASTVAVMDYTLNVYENVKVWGMNSDGTFQTTFLVPLRLSGGTTKADVARGNYYVYLTYFFPALTAGGISYNATAILQLTPFSVVIGATTISPDNGAVGTEVNINGTYFGSTEPVSVKYDGQEVPLTGNGITSSNGTFGPAKFTIPPGIVGEHILITSGNVSGTTTQMTFTVKPNLTITPASGSAGTLISVLGTGFGRQVQANPTFGGEALTPTQTDTNGSFAFSFGALKKAAGSYDIVVTDGNGNSEKATFSLTAATLNTNPGTGIAGTQVFVTGSNFLPNRPVTVTFNDIKMTAATSDAQGAVSTNFTVPNLVTGTYVVKATDGTNIKTADFTIPATAAISPETSQALPGHVGSQLTIAGAGFAPAGTVTIKFDGARLSTTNVKDDRSFSAIVTVPAGSAGEHIISASDGTNTRDFTFFMESVPPATPLPQKPEMNLKAAARTIFDWQDVTDDSQVTYTLQVADKDDFSPSSIVFEKTGLTQSEYTLTSEQKLATNTKEDPYYWHVKAIDGAGNQSAWSGTGSFYVSGFLSLSQTTIYVLIGIGVLVLAFFGFWLGRRTAYY